MFNPFDFQKAHCSGSLANLKTFYIRTISTVGGRSPRVPNGFDVEGFVVSRSNRSRISLHSLVCSIFGTPVAFGPECSSSFLSLDFSSHSIGTVLGGSRGRDRGLSSPRDLPGTLFRSEECRIILLIGDVQVCECGVCHRLWCFYDSPIVFVKINYYCYYDDYY